MQINVVHYGYNDPHKKYGFGAISTNCNFVVYNIDLYYDYVRYDMMVLLNGYEIVSSICIDLLIKVKLYLSFHM